MRGWRKEELDSKGGNNDRTGVVSQRLCVKAACWMMVTFSVMMKSIGIQSNLGCLTG